MQPQSRLKSLFKKTAIAAVALGGFLCFAGAGSAQAREVVVVRRPGPVVIVRHGFYGPRHEVIFVHGYRDRFGCWHRY
jgi:hypothetical protein